MLGRSVELQNLNHYFDRDGSQILVLYGQRNIGKRELLKQFVEDKDHYYYSSRICSEREQIYQWGCQLAREELVVSQFPSFRDIFSALSSKGSDKLVLIIDEFQNIVKTSDTFMQQLISFVHEQWNKRQVLVVLSSSNVGWIENNMVEKIGDAAFELSGLIKIRELEFQDLTSYFTNFSIQQCIEAYAILGGYPGLWKYFDDKLSIKDNIKNTLLSPNGGLYAEAQRMLEEQLRETNVYNTIMFALAEGHLKLNDLFAKTDFSRAKISVYLKNLMQLELVEKVFSYDTDGRANAQKGIYRISNHLMHFYYTFLFANQSECTMLDESVFYQDYIQPHFKKYVSEYYRKVCAQHLQQQNDYGKLPFHFETSGEWIGKVGNIDLIAQNEEGKTLLCICNWDKPMMTYDDYELLLLCAKKAKIKADFIYLYSAARFDERLTLEAKVKKNVSLINVVEMQS